MWWEETRREETRREHVTATRTRNCNKNRNTPTMPWIKTLRKSKYRKVRGGTRGEERMAVDKPDLRSEFVRPP